jgi:hypothetical protein
MTNIEREYDYGDTEIFKPTVVAHITHIFSIEVWPSADFLSVKGRDVGDARYWDSSSSSFYPLKSQN